MNQHVQFCWTDDNHSEAVEMWRDGYSFGQIAKALGTSRGAVCGYAARNRESFPLRQDKGLSNQKVQPHVGVPKDFDMSRLRIPECEPLPYSVVIDSGLCQFPVSNDAPGPDMQCCGLRATHKRYCAYHAKLSWRPRA